MVNPVSQLGQQDSLVNQAGTLGLPQRITQAIKMAATRTGVDFSYLLHKAAQESGFDPNAKASTSSATGLFQFTNQTWLRMVKAHGDEYGLGSYADHIQVDSSGAAHVSNPAWRQAILSMRKDPQISAEMAGELDKENMDSLHANVGGKIGATDLYLAHFLGAGGASDFLNQMKSNPNAKAADVLPEAAAANPAVFYGSNGQPRSLTQIYQHFAQKFDPSSNTTMVASVQPHYRSQTPSSHAASYEVASAATSSAPVSGNYVSSVMSEIKAGTTSSLMATMILAQMNTGDISSPAMSYGMSSLPHENRKNTMAILGAIA